MSKLILYIHEFDENCFKEKHNTKLVKTILKSFSKVKVLIVIVPFLNLILKFSELYNVSRGTNWAEQKHVVSTG